MGYERILTDEIDAVLDNLRAQGLRWDANWITQAVCDRHKTALPNTEEAEFWRHGAYANTRDAVRKRINASAGDQQSGDSRQIRLPGYEHLQEYYIVKRRGVDVGIRIDKLTDAELTSKIALYDTMSAACAAHADELRDYQNVRRSRRGKRAA